MKVAAISFLLAGFAGFIGMDACHAIADRHTIGPMTALLCEMSGAVAIGGIVLGLVLGIVDLVRKFRRG